MFLPFKDFASATLGIEKVLDVEDPLDSLHVVKNLQKKGRIYLDSLMKDLLKLDSLSGAGVREARKKQVSTVSGKDVKGWKSAMFVSLLTKS